MKSDPVRLPELRVLAWDPLETQTPVRKSRMTNKPQGTKWRASYRPLNLFGTASLESREEEMRVQIVHEDRISPVRWLSQTSV